jgi:hypothetical protein
MWLSKDLRLFGENFFVSILQRSSFVVGNPLFDFRLRIYNICRLDCARQLVLSPISIVVACPVLVLGNCHSREMLLIRRTRSVASIVALLATPESNIVLRLVFRCLMAIIVQPSLSLNKLTVFHLHWQVDLVVPLLLRCTSALWRREF